MRGGGTTALTFITILRTNIILCVAFMMRTRYAFTIVAFCIMSNHFHILMKSEEDLSKIMKLINRRYSDYYSKRYRHVGRIYQRRYYSKLTSNPAALLIVSRYIHRNPIETRTPMVDNLGDYPHSSFPFYIDPHSEPPPYIDTSQLPQLLPVSFEKTIDGYSVYCLQEFGKEEIEEIEEMDDGDVIGMEVAEHSLIDS